MSSEQRTTPTKKQDQQRSLARRSEIGRERRKKNLENLLRSSVEFLAESGFESSTIEEIAASSDMSLRSFYNYFPRKQDVATAVDYLLYEVAAQYDQRVVPDEFDIVERMAFGMSLSLQVGIEEPAITRVSFDICLSRYPTPQTFWLRAVQQFRLLYEEGVKQGRFVPLQESILQDFLFTPLYFVSNRVAETGQQALIADAVVQALTALGVSKDQSREVVARQDHSMVLNKIDSGRAYEKAAERFLDDVSTVAKL